jgi:DNA-binding response OmpR family regulator
MSMPLVALLVSTDDAACAVLGSALPDLGIALERFSDLPAAIDRLHQRRFDALVLDFENQQAADELLQEARRLHAGAAPVTVALLADRTAAREILTSGAHFLLYKPVSEVKVRASLRAAAALLKRERRRAHRVPVQAPVELMLPGVGKAEGILLDLSESGMEVLTAQPQIAGTILRFSFRLTDGSLEVHAHGQVAWANPNGQNGVHFLDIDELTKDQLKAWLRAVAFTKDGGPEEAVPHCKLTDLSLGGCYVETDSPFPERALVELCLTINEIAVRTEGLVRVAHPGYGMGVEFPSRTPEQRAQVGELINALQACPTTSPDLSISPHALMADLTQFEPASETDAFTDSLEQFEDPLLELLRQGYTLQQDDFLVKLRRQRAGQSVGT